MVIAEDSTMTVKYRIAIKVLFLSFNLCLQVMLDNLTCSFTSISFLTNETLQMDTKNEQNKSIIK
jgi:hypothetical protein